MVGADNSVANASAPPDSRVDRTPPPAATPRGLGNPPSAIQQMGTDYGGQASQDAPGESGT